MRNRATAWTYLALLLLAGPAGAETAVRFFAVGDAPYSEREYELLETLVAEQLPGGAAFLAHVGDIKGGGAPCGDDSLSGVAELFRRQPVPVVYTPGDNEWTDCRRFAAGRYVPEERLALLRHKFFDDPDVLRLRSLGTEHPDADYPENYFFRYRGLLFATVHLVGSGNNLIPSDPAAIAEFETRSAANRRHLERVAEAAQSPRAQAILLLLHANPRFEEAIASREFAPFRADLGRLLAGFPGPVLAIHGDTHHFRFDQPLQDNGDRRARFYRLEVPGSPIIGGVWVTVDTAADAPFAVELVYPDSLDLLMAE